MDQSKVESEMSKTEQNRVKQRHILNDRETFSRLRYNGVINRPGVAGDVLQSPLSFIDSFIDSVSEPFPPNLLIIITPKQ